MKTLKQPVSQFIKLSEEDELAKWTLPHVEQNEKTDKVEPTNALGLKPTWRYEPPESEQEIEPQPLTAEEIEEIRKAAYDEGFNQGKEEGFAKGYEEGKASGHEEGKTQGHQEGVEQGLAEGQEQITQLTEQWQNLINKLHQPMQDVDKNVEQQLFILVAQLTEAVVHHEAKTNTDILLSAISEGIKILPAHEAQTQIYLHPADIKRVEHAFGSEHIQESGWRLLPAPQLEEGGCQIENSTSNIDMRLKTRLNDVLDPFLQNALHQ